MNQRDQSPLIHLAWRVPQVDITHSSSKLSVCLAQYLHAILRAFALFFVVFFSFFPVCPSVVMRSVANCVCRRSVFCSIHGGHLGRCSVPRQTQAHGQVWVSCFHPLHRCVAVFSENSPQQGWALMRAATKRVGMLLQLCQTSGR